MLTFFIGYGLGILSGVAGVAVWFIVQWNS